MGKKGDAPSPPDPMETYGAQQSASIGSAIANQTLGNVNQVTPNGSLTFNQTGSTKWTDPLTGKTFDLPQLTATQTLSRPQQRLQNKQTRAEIGLADLAGQQIRRLGSILGAPVDLADAPGVSAPQIRGISAQAPNLQEGFSGTGNIAKRFGDAGEITRTYGDDEGYAAGRQKVEDALMARMNPQLQRDRADLDAKLSAQGIKLGSAAYDRTVDEFTRQSNDARLGAILGAGEEQTRLAGLDAQRAGFENDAQSQAFEQLLGRATFRNQGQQQHFDQALGRTAFSNAARQQEFGNRLARVGFNNNARQQQFTNGRGLRADYLNEQYASRNQPINEIAALLGTGQVQNPNFISPNAPQVPTTDYAGLVGQNYNQRLAGYQMQQQNNPWNGVMGGLFGLGQAGIMASDERLKDDVEPVGAEIDGIPVYEYSYKDDPADTRHVGVMAQDALKRRPDAVVKMGRYLGVDYGKLRRDSQTAA